MLRTDTIAFVKRLVAPGLLRTHLGRTLLVGVVPLLALSAVVLTVSDRLIYDRFERESALVANGLAADIGERVLLVARDANLIAEIQPVREVIATGDTQSVRAQLIPLKGRLDLDIVSVADPDSGDIIFRAQDPLPGERPTEALLQRISARAEQAWVIDGEAPEGVVVRALAPVRTSGRITAVIETGMFLDDGFLRSVQSAARGALTDASAAQLAIFWDGTVRATTLPNITSDIVPSLEDLDRTPDLRLARTLAIGGQRYYAVFTIVESHQPIPAILASFVPLAPIEAAHDAFATLVAVLLAMLVLLITILAYRFTTALTSPLARLAAAAQSVQVGNLALMLPSRSPHEIGALERSFETMIASLADRDATNRRLLGELEQQALFDSLTGLPNRTLLQDRLRQTILAADRAAGRFAFVLLDLDRFKDINDTFGHHAGDMLLKEVGPQIRAVLRESDTVARFGGDEFAILLSTTSDEVGAVQAAQRILERLQRLFVVEGLALQVDASLGIAIYPLHGRDATALIQHADAAMYEAKRSRLGYAVYSTGAEEASRDRLVLLGELRDAIDHRQLSVHYQPMVDPARRSVIGMESLVRWQHPRLGLLAASRFVPFAEQTGLIRPLGEWVLSTALEQCARWSSVGIDMAIAVNLSARDLPDPLLPDRVEKALSQTNVSPSRLKLEITEGLIMGEPTRSLEVLERLRAMGIELSIDDFGTGYSSLSYLKRLPVHEIKIDRAFVADMLNDAGASAIVRSVIELGHNLGLRVVAEGVESAEQADALSSIGCDGLQGYYISPAVPAENVAAWLGEGRWTAKRMERVEPIQLLRSRRA